MKDETDENGNGTNGDLPPGGFDDNADFDDFGSGNNTLGDLWRNNPLVKVGVVVGAIVLLVGGVVLFGGKSDQLPSSSVGRGSEVKQAPGAEVSKTYAEAVQEQNTVQAEEAQRQGTSAIPVPITPPKEPAALPDEQANTEDPLARWRRIQEERTKRDVVKKPATVEADPNAEAVKALADAMAKQMESVLKNVKLAGPEYQMIISNKEFDEEKAKQMEAQAQWEAEHGDDDGDGIPNGQDEDYGNEGGEGKDGEDGEEDLVDILLPAGQIVYAQLLTEANTDAPGPVMAQIVSGDLAGSRLIGSFKASQEYLVLNFNTIVIDGIGQQVDAVALDPKTSKPGLVSEVDHRYFKRVILPAAAAFIEGLGAAIADTGNTNVTVDGSTVIQSSENLNTKEEVYKGVEQAASKLGNILDQEGQQTRPLLTLAAGTPIAVMFSQPVIKQDKKTTGQKQAGK